jgi:hypothetical protein
MAKKIAMDLALALAKAGDKAAKETGLLSNKKPKK